MESVSGHCVCGSPFDTNTSDLIIRMMYSEILDFHNVEGAEDQAQEGLGAVQDAQAQAQQATMASLQQQQQQA